MPAANQGQDADPDSQRHQEEHAQKPNLLHPSQVQRGVYAKGLQGERPRLSFDPSEWETQAEKVLSRTSWGYVYGSAGSRETTNNNAAAFQKWALMPNRLVRIPQISLRVSLFSRTFAYPLALGPVGVLDIVHRRKEVAAARAAAECSVPFVLSTASSSTFEEVAEAMGDAERWYQLYWPSNDANDLTVSLLTRAKQSGYSVLVVTLDTYALGWRPMDLDQGYNPFILPNISGVALPFSDPVFHRMWKAESGGKDVWDDPSTAAMYWKSLDLPGTGHTWEDLEWLRAQWDGPIVLKGILSIGDARRAVKAGMQGVVVSNHGGRQVDGSVGALTMLPEIVDAVGEHIDVLFDSGVRNGVHVVKALALGAKMVLLGRPYVYGLALEGEEGVKHVIKALLGELELSLQLSGIARVEPKDLNRQYLRWVG